MSGEAARCPSFDSVSRICAPGRGAHRTQRGVPQGPCQPTASPSYNSSQGTRNTTGWGPECDFSHLGGRWESQPSATALVMTVAGHIHLSPSCGPGSGDPIRASSTDPHPGGSGDTSPLPSLPWGKLSPNPRAEHQRGEKASKSKYQIEYSHPTSSY